jgi:hypothetical protein
MPIQTNIPLTSTAGLAVPTASYCVLDIHISGRKFLEVTMIFYKDKATYDGQVEAPFLPNNAGLEPRYLRQLNNAEYAAFTNVAIHQFLQVYLEGFFGPGTTQLVQ